MRPLGWLAIAAALASAAGVVRPAPAPAVSPRDLPGWPLYDRLCLACHGAAGDGRGPGAPYTAGRPRDLTRGDFAWRSTALGTPPTDGDLRTTIRYGAPGTSMHGFELTDDQLAAVVDVVKAFAPRAFAIKPRPVALGAPPAPDLERGAALWTAKGCAACHGATGAGDGPAARAAGPRPYDLTREPLHRPRATDRDLRRAAALSIATGRAAMPGYAGALSDAELWALADHVVALQATARPRPRGIDAQTIDLDRTARIATGTWPGHDPEEAIVWGSRVPPQGDPPTTLAPAQASLWAPQCARCHAKQYREWERSIHRVAASPGLAAQMMGMAPDRARACLACHAPLAEQATDDRLRAQSISCAGCHLRGWTRRGPPKVAPSLLTLPRYPLETLAIYERADFCMPCHQLPPRTAVGGRPLLDTYREWLEGPYMRRGIQCQHCHMPNREHTFLGVHDPHTFREGIALTVRADVRGGAVTVVAELTNAGAGHYLPTTTTPAAWLTIALIDAAGAPIEGASSYVRIGRDLRFDGRWHEREDTRIPPGETLTMARAWSGGRTAAAVSARVRVVVSPDDYYEHLYERRLAGRLPAARRALYERALARARKDHYTALDRVVPITR